MIKSSWETATRRIELNSHTGHTQQEVMMMAPRNTQTVKSARP